MFAQHLVDRADGARRLAVHFAPGLRKGGVKPSLPAPAEPAAGATSEDGAEGVEGGEGGLEWEHVMQSVTNGPGGALLRGLMDFVVHGDMAGEDGGGDALPVPSDAKDYDL